MNIEEYRNEALGKMLAEHVVDQLQEHATDSNILIVPCPRTLGPSFGGVVVDYGQTGFIDLRAVVDVESFARAVQTLLASIQVLNEVNIKSGAIVFVSSVLTGPNFQILVHEMLPKAARDTKPQKNGPVTETEPTE